MQNTTRTNGSLQHEIPNTTTDDENRAAQGDDRCLFAPIQAWQAVRKN
jgi:hypothetical protein